MLVVGVELGIGGLVGDVEVGQGGQEGSQDLLDDCVAF